MHINNTTKSTVLILGLVSDTQSFKLQSINYRMTSEQWIEKDMIGGSYSLMWATVSGFVWRG
jgi:hypothetical protein